MHRYRLGFAVIASVLLAGCGLEYHPVESPAPRLFPVVEAGHPIAFHQALPFARGEIKVLASPISITAPGISGIAAPVTYWPDGSVQWLRVEGVAKEGIASREPIAFKVGGTAQKAGAEISTLEVIGDEGINWRIPGSGLLYRLSPQASLVRVDQPKPEPQTDPDWLDQEGQYAWAVPVGALGNAAPIALTLRIRREKVEEENALYRVVCFQGDGGASLPGSGLEWQLRLKVYHDLPLIRAEMTWIAQWDPKEYALTSASWKITPEKPWSRFSTQSGVERERLLVTSDMKGAGGVAIGGGALVATEAGDRNGIVALAEGGQSLAVGLYNFADLGPNHLLGDKGALEIASWSALSGRALDLRRSTLREDYGTNPVDLKWNGKGVSRTTYASFMVCDNADDAKAVVRHEAARDYLWFPDAEALCRTDAIGPYSYAAITANPEAMRGMQANLHFLRASRERWAWKGWANFGDIRTNFARASEPKRGLYAGRWALNGRYGWRNTSGTISSGFLQTGLLLGDRALILAGLDNAEHIVDVDAYHGSLFAEDQGKEGGMRRRNRDHWSGDVQAQYAPNSGLYLSQWLSGNRRMRDTLAGLRGFASRQSPGNSAFPAQAWLMHYRETRDPAALKEATRLLEASAEWWRTHAKTDLPDLAALYAGNFRIVSDGMSTLVLFHQATGDPRFLEAIRASTVAHPEGQVQYVGPEALLYLQAYLRSQGVSGLLGVEQGAARLAAVTPLALPDPKDADYAALEQVILTQLPPAGDPKYRESANIAGRANYLPVILEQFGKQAQP